MFQPIFKPDAGAMPASQAAVCQRPGQTLRGQIDEQDA